MPVDVRRLFVDGLLTYEHNGSPEENDAGEK